MLTRHSLKSTPIALILVAACITSAQAENLDHVRQLLSTKQCQNCDLVGSGLVLANLQGANLQGANLSGANLSQANLQGANLSGANLVGASLVGANLSGAQLTNADVRSSDFRNATLSGADMSGTQSTGAAMRGAVGIPDGLTSHEDYYRWGLDAAKNKRYEMSLDYFNQSLARKSDYSSAMLGRGLTRIELGDQPGAIADLEIASSLFEKEGDKLNAEATTKMLTSLKNPEKPKKPGFGQAVMGILGTLLQLYFLR